MGVFDWFKSKNVQRLTEGEQVEQNVRKEAISVNEQKDENPQISFNVDLALNKYSDWFMQRYTSDNKYEGPLGIYNNTNGESIITLNYYDDMSKKEDDIILAVAKLGTKEEAKSEKLKQLTRTMDKMLGSIYRKSDSRMYSLEKFVRTHFDDMQNHFDIDFTQEGEKILLNYNKQSIYTERTANLEKDRQGWIVGYRKIENQNQEQNQEYSAFEIPNEQNSYTASTTITVPIKKCNLFKLDRNQIPKIIYQLYELYNAADKIGMFTGTKVDDLEQYKTMTSVLQKTKYKEEMDQIKTLPELQKGESKIKKYAMNVIMETSLYYEDLIEYYVIMSFNKEGEEIKANRELFSAALNKAKTEYYNRMMQMSKLFDEADKSEQKDDKKDFRESIKVDLDSIPKEEKNVNTDTLEKTLNNKEQEEK